MEYTFVTVKDICNDGRWMSNRLCEDEIICPDLEHDMDHLLSCYVDDDNIVHILDWLKQYNHAVEGTAIQKLKLKLVGDECD